MEPYFSLIHLVLFRIVFGIIFGKIFGIIFGITFGIISGITLGAQPVCKYAGGQTARMRLIVPFDLLLVFNSLITHELFGT